MKNKEALKLAEGVFEWTTTIIKVDEEEQR